MTDTSPLRPIESQAHALVGEQVIRIVLAKQVDGDEISGVTHLCRRRG